MSFLKRMERRFGHWAVPNITVIIIAGQVLLYLAHMAQAAQNAGGSILARVVLVPELVAQGEVWRLVTFAFVPPDTVLFFAAIQWMLFYMFGTSLEHHWGTFRYNVFLLLGLVANIAASFVAWGLGTPNIAGNEFLYGTVFLAFARLFPNFTLNLFFILPIQIKWLALLMWAFYGYGLIVGDAMARLLIVASVFNYLVFFGHEHWRDLRFGVRRRTFQAKASAAAKRPVHKCVVCGLDSNESPKTLFRYCSKCDGQRCYCPEHIHDHQHVKESEESPSRAPVKSGRQP